MDPQVAASTCETRVIDVSSTTASIVSTSPARTRPEPAPASKHQDSESPVGGFCFGFFDYIRKGFEMTSVKNSEKHETNAPTTKAAASQVIIAAPAPKSPAISLHQSSFMDDYHDSEVEDALRIEIGRLEREIAQLRTLKLDSAQHEELRGALYRKVEVLSQETEEYKSKLEVLGARLAAKEDALVEQDRELAACRAEIQAAQKAHKETKSELQRQVSTVAALSKERDLAVREAASLQAALKKSSEREKELTLLKIELEESLAREKAKLSQAFQDADKLLQEIDSLRRARTEDASAMTQQQEQDSMIAQRVDELEKELEQVHSENQKMLLEKEAMIGQQNVQHGIKLRHLKKENAELKQELAALKAKPLGKDKAPRMPLGKIADSNAVIWLQNDHA